MRIIGLLLGILAWIVAATYLSLVVELNARLATATTAHSAAGLRGDVRMTGRQDERRNRNRP